MAKNAKKNLTKILICFIFIALGAGAVIGAFRSLLEFEIGGIISSVLGLVMFAAGILGFCGKIKVCRVLGVVICVLSAYNFIMALAGGAFDATSLTGALLAWIFFDLN